MKRFVRLGFALTAMLMLASGAIGATPTVLNATVGPGFTITLKKGAKNVTSLKRGAYKIVVDDKSSVHNFHLTGPSLNKKTMVLEIRKRTWNVTLKKGTHTFVCDPHASSMRGTITVT